MRKEFLKWYRRASKTLAKPGPTYELIPNHWIAMKAFEAGWKHGAASVRNPQSSDTQRMESQ